MDVFPGGLDYRLRPREPIAYGPIHLRRDRRALLAHEVGHAVAAAFWNQEQINIHLHALGGTTVFEAESLRPSQHVAIALAGPATGIAIGVGVLLGALVSPSFRETTLFHDLLVVTFGWSALNLIPAWPLDGGVLLAALVKRQWIVSTLSIAIAVIGIIGCSRVHRPEFVVFCLVLLFINVLAIPAVSRIVRHWDSQVG